MAVSDLALGTIRDALPPDVAPEVLVAVDGLSAVMDAGRALARDLIQAIEPKLNILDWAVLILGAFSNIIGVLSAFGVDIPEGVNTAVGVVDALRDLAGTVNVD
jgi:hypothetical protein